MEAARSALQRAKIDPVRVGAVYIGSESHPYAVKPSGTVLVDALGIGPDVHVVAVCQHFARSQFPDEPFLSGFAPEADVLRMIDHAEAHSSWIQMIVKPQNARREVHFTRTAGA